MAFHSAGLTINYQLVFAEQWLRKRRWHMIFSSFMKVLCTEMGRMSAEQKYPCCGDLIVEQKASDTGLLILASGFCLVIM